MIIDPAKDLNGSRNRTRPDACVECGIPLKNPRYGPPPEGFRKHAGKGLCVRCYKPSRKPRSAGLMVRNCRDCGRPMRSQHERLADHPGTVQHSGRGLCKTDYNKHLATGTLGAYEEVGSPALPKPTPRAVVDPAEAERRLRHDTDALLGFLRPRWRRIGRDGTLDDIPALASGLVA